MQRKSKTPRFKLQRRLMTELPGLGKPGALDRKPYPPGENGAQRIKYSDFRLQLEEKQKIKIHYNLQEEQLIRLVKKAKKNKNGKWIQSLINLLEKRLENIVFRAGFAGSMASAAQMISHGQVLVNGRKATIRSMLVTKGQQISLSARGVRNQIYQNALMSPRLPTPEWLQKKANESEALVILMDEPDLKAVPFAFDDSLVTSYYSKV